MINPYPYWKPGTKLVLAHPDNGYPDETKLAHKLIENCGPDKIYTIKSIQIGKWNTTLTFEEVSGYWNSVQFAYYNGDE